MDENVLRWITKITNSFVECRCGEMCHVHVTIRERDILFRAICPKCRRVYSVAVHILLFGNSKEDPTDYCLKEVSKGFKQKQAEVNNEESMD